MQVKHRFSFCQPKIFFYLRMGIVKVLEIMVFKPFSPLPGYSWPGVVGIDSINFFKIKKIRFKNNIVLMMLNNDIDN
jgi:hypothetical protein